MIHVIHILALLALSPLLYFQSKRLWNEPHFQFFPLLIGFGLWLLLAKAKFESVGASRRTVGKLVSLGGLSVGAFGIYVLSPMFAHIAFMFLLCGWALQVLSHLRWTRIIAICAVMMICVPPPANLDKVLITKLQSVSSEVCEGALDALFIPSLQSGNVIEMVQKKLFVEEACSGIDSLYALAAVAAGMLVLTQTALIPSLLTVTTVPCWAIFGNLCRLIVITLALHYFQIDLSSGTSHQILGLVVFVMVSCCHFATAHMFSHLMKPVAFLPPNSSEDARRERSGPFVGLYDAIVCWPKLHNTPLDGQSETPQGRSSLGSRLLSFASVALAILLLAGGVLSVLALQRGKDFAASAGVEVSKEQAEAMLSEVDVDSIFGKMNPSTKPEFFSEMRSKASEWGIHSRGWRFQFGNRPCLISLDMPFYGWHDLSGCYARTGWTIYSNDFANLLSQSEKVPFQRCLMTSQTGEYGAVWFWDFDISGRVEKGSPLLASRLSGNLFSRYFNDNGEKKPQMTRFQVQLFVTSEQPIEASDLESLENLYEALFVRIREKVSPILNQLNR